MISRRLVVRLRFRYERRFVALLRAGVSGSYLLRKHICGVISSTTSGFGCLAARVGVIHLSEPFLNYILVSLEVV